MFSALKNCSEPESESLKREHYHQAEKAEHEAEMTSRKESQEQAGASLGKVNMEKVRNIEQLNSQAITLKNTLSDMPAEPNGRDGLVNGDGTELGNVSSIASVSGFRK